MMHNKYLCSKYFLESDFTTADRVVVVPAPVPSLNSLPQEDCTHVVFPTTFKSLGPSPVTHIPIHAHGPFTSFKMFEVQPLPTAATNFCSERNLVSPKPCKYKCFWWGTQAYQSLQQATTLYWLQWGAVENTWQQLFDDTL
ncbi:uncharacterized protein LOC117282216 [Cryptotermes secundus]|uniref:uncharacterized protein LOC117282216 n=1 Tax=Cryptotermes secundus TaxID=105785 RepID=UPI001454B98E|nr:uncharacterized protein LOC117282216 [Cryptotermes secundus]